MKCPKIIGAAAVLANDRNKIIHNKPYHCALPKAGADELLIDLTLDACDQVLSFAHCRPDQIDLIISLSTSLSHFVENTRIIGPRISNPIQKELQADNAYVFDLLDADWVFALDLAQTYGTQLGYKRALIVRGECLSHSVLPDPQSGFDIADGAAAILVDLAYQTSSNDETAMSYIEYPHLTAASMLLMPHVNNMDDKKGVLNFPYQASLSASIKQSMLSLYQSTDDVQAVIYEQWLPDYCITPEQITCSLWPTTDLNTLNKAPFEVALGLQSLLNNQKAIDTKALLLTFAPFNLRVGGLSVYV